MTLSGRLYSHVQPTDQETEAQKSQVDLLQTTQLVAGES